jgi:hypothetical protein
METKGQKQKRNDNMGWIAESYLKLVKWNRKATFPASINDKHIYKAHRVSPSV